MAEAKQPILKRDDFPVKLAVWEHLDEQQRPYYSAKLQKSYKDRDGNWKNSDYLNDQDWLKAAALLTEAWRLLRVKEPKAKEGDSAAPAEVNAPF